MSKIFYSWQSDRPTGTCRNFIERALQSAIDRLHADADIESSLREELELDKDTKNVPGSPAIFDTITAKIASASVFVPDLTFVGQRVGQRPVSNPNVLVEYGYALHKPGSPRILAVMNDVYGKPTVADMPFNLAHKRFPITYTLAEDADEDARKAARKLLVEKFVSALQIIFGSPEYKAESTRPPSALEVAALHQKDLDYESALSALRHGDGPGRVRQNVARLFDAIKSKCDQVALQYGFGIECGWELKPHERFQSCVLKTPYLGIDVRWDHPLIDSLEDAKLGVHAFQGRLYLPGEFKGGVHIQPPKIVGEAFYKPTLSTDRELGWAKAGKNRQDPSFLSNEELADVCVSQLLNLLRRKP